MAPGKHLSVVQRQQVVHNCITGNMDPSIAHDVLFAGDDAIYTFKRLKILVSKLRMMSDAQLAKYSAGPIPRKNRAGRPKKFNDLVRTELCNTRLRNNKLKLKSIRSLFLKNYFDNDPTLTPSLSTISRVYKSAQIKRKVTEIRNINASPADQLQYLDRVAPINPMRMIDIDETLCTNKEFEEKYGWGPVGEAALHYQIRINGVAYSTIAAYSTKGFLCWSIYAGSVTAVEFEHFIWTKVALITGEESICMLDNASIHKTMEIRNVLEMTLGGLYLYSPAYSLELKPIELGFANIKRWIREHETEAAADPIGYINQAFILYSTDGEHCDAGTVIVLFCIFCYLFIYFFNCLFIQLPVTGYVTSTTINDF